MEKPLLSLRGLSKFYTNGQTVAVGLNQVSLDFRRGEFVAITGESGSGKSTLAHVLGGILTYESGEMLFDGKPTSHYDGVDWEGYRRDRISFISQNYGILPGSTVMGNVVSALRLSGMSLKEAKEEANQILHRVDLWQFRRRRAARLSSGQKQRLAIARALAKPAPILLADEPTGNLDAENSAKVIELLAEAAKDRLVILITHEYEEAEAWVTRHVALQDAKVIMDMPVNPAKAPEEDVSTTPRKKRHLGGYIARLQLRARPVWCAMMAMLLAFSAFAVFAFLGTFIVSLDDTSTRIYDDSAFKNGDPLRIVVVHTDGSPMTKEDAEKIIDLEYVESVERYGYISDVGYGYIEDEHYETVYGLGGSDNPLGGGGYYTTSHLQVNLGLPFMKTVPVLKDEESFLTAGRLPESPLEVVAVGGEDLIGTTMTVYIQDQGDWDQLTYLANEMTVVGVTDRGEGLYFQDDFAMGINTFVMNGRHDLLIMPLLDTEMTGSFMSSAVLEEALRKQENHFGLGIEVLFTPELKTVSHRWVDDERLVFMIPAPTTAVDNAVLVFQGATAMDTMPVSISVSERDFANFYPRYKANWGDQFSITIENYAYTERVIDALEELGYGAASPYQQCSTKQDPELASLRIQTLVSCLAVMVVVLALQVLVLRAMFVLQTETYKILSNIGLDCKTAKRSVFWQMMGLMIAGEAIAAGCIYLCGKFEIARIVAVLRYITMPGVIAIVAVHIAGCVLATLWVMSSIRKQVYPFAAIDYDLDLGTEVEA